VQRSAGGVKTRAGTLRRGRVCDGPLCLLPV